MTDHYDQLAVEVDPSFASALKQRLDEQRQRHTQAADSPKVARRPDQSTEEEPTMIELETSSRTDNPRQGPKRVLLAALLAAAAVVAIAFVAIRNDDDPEGPADQPSTTVTVPTTTPPPALFGAVGATLAPGTYSLDEVDGAPTTPIHITVGDGWSPDESRWAIGKGCCEGMSFSRPQAVYRDACHPGDGYHPGPLTTLEGLVAALTEQGGWVGVTTPTDISIDGYIGRAFQRTAPADLSACAEGQLTTWDGPFHTPYHNPGESVTVWVLDLNGTVVVIEAGLDAGQPAEAAAELAAMLASLHIAG